MTAASEPVLLEKGTNGIALVTLNRPEQRNAVNPALAHRLEAIVEEIEADPAVRVAVLTGAGGKVFSAGADLKVVAAGRVDELMTDKGGFAGFVYAKRKKPWIAAVEGLALAGGCELALACDLRVGHPEVLLQMPPVRMGLVYTPDGVARLTAICGEARAREMLLCARPIPAEEALSWGLLSRLVPPDEVREAALRLAEEIARGAPLATQGTKWLLERLLEHGPALPAPIAAEAMARRRAAWYSEDAREARAAFRERRPPRFQGK